MLFSHTGEQVEGGYSHNIQRQMGTPQKNKKKGGTQGILAVAKDKKQKEVHLRY